jgi:hypothetical protein
MPTTYKVLGQSNPAATTLTSLYTVPASTSAIVSTLTISNSSASDGTFRISVAVAGAADSAKQYLAYDASIRGNGFITLTLGISLATTDIIKVYSSSTSLAFIAFGTELS